MNDNKTTTIRAFDINEYIRFKPSAETKESYSCRQRELRAAFPRLADRFPDEMRLDADGFYRGQAWHVFALLAPQCVAGGRPIEDGIIYVEFPE